MMNWLIDIQRSKWSILPVLVFMGVSIGVSLFTSNDYLLIIIASGTIAIIQWISRRLQYIKPSLVSQGTSRHNFIGSLLWVAVLCGMFLLLALNPTALPMLSVGIGLGIYMILIVYPIANLSTLIKS